MTAAGSATAPGDAVPAKAPPVLTAGTAAAIGLYGLADAGAWAGWALGLWGPGTAAVLHLGLSALVAAEAWRALRRDDPTGLGTGFAAAAILGLGPAGAVGMMVATLLYARFRRRAVSFDDWFDSLFPELQAAPGQLLADRIRTGREDGASQAGVAPFIDTLRNGTREQKEAVIGMLARHFSPAFAPALRMALADETPSIRVQAATAAATIENGLMQTALRLSAAATANPGDPAAQMALARHADMHAYLGLLDPQQEREMRERAVGLYGIVLSLDPEVVEARVAVGRGLMRLGRIEEAMAWLSDCLDRGLLRLDLVDWYAECLYRLGDLDRLRAELRRFRPLIDAAGEDDRRLAERLRFWLQEEPDAAAPAPLAERVA